MVATATPDAIAAPPAPVCRAVLVSRSQMHPAAHKGRRPHGFGLPPEERPASVRRLLPTAGGGRLAEAETNTSTRTWWDRPLSIAPRPRLAPRSAGSILAGARPHEPPFKASSKNLLTSSRFWGQPSLRLTSKMYARPHEPTSLGRVFLPEQLAKHIVRLRRPLGPLNPPSPSPERGGDRFQISQPEKALLEVESVAALADLPGPRALRTRACVARAV